MKSKTVLGLVCLLLVAGISFAQQEEEEEILEATGTVKSVAADKLTVTHEGKDMTFIVDNETTVIAKGASHKMREAEGAGKSTTITDFVMEKQTVAIKYIEDDAGKLMAREVRVR
ncbi:MAG TPA: hypothetical protein VLK65_21770 [Vicinamibacteria bacterium]|nr:hypothetical protein [Vicinamibacteria bacterium]